MTEIKYSPYTVGCRIGDTIYLHPKLYTDPELYQAVLTHEKQHTNNFNRTDFFADVSNIELRDVKTNFYKFMFKNPKTFIALLPITRIDKKWTIDIAMLVFFLSIIILGGILFLA